MAKSIVIFGGSGFIGQALLKALTKKEIPLIVLSRSPLPVTLLAKAPLLKNYCGDFVQPEDFADFLSNASAVIHCASTSTPGKSAGQPRREATDNLLPTLALMEAWQNLPHCHLLYLSSGGALYQPGEGRAATESSALEPRSYYGAGKIAAEYFIAAACAQFSLQATIIRPSNIYGPGQTPKAGFGIIANAFAHLKSQQPLTIWGDGQSIRDYLYIDDFIELCLSVLEKPGQDYQVFNAASGQGIRLVDLLQLIEKISAMPLSIQYQTSRKVDIPTVALSSEKAKKIYNWQARTPLEAGLKQTWQWWQQFTGKTNA
jgi:UDP-glucose 4-epimerase